MNAAELPLWRQVIATLLLAAGVVVCSIGVLGMVRLSDPYNRIHAAGKGVVLGVVSILLAGPLLGGADVAVRSLATACLVLLTMPLASHVLARAQYDSEKEGAGDEDRAARGGDSPRGRPGIGGGGESRT